MTNQENDNKFFEIVKAAYIPFRSYSGRGMCNKQCLGIECPSVGPTIAALISACVDDDECSDACYILAEVIDKMETDSMGRDIIIYFPTIAWTDEMEKYVNEVYNDNDEEDI